LQWKSGRKKERSQGEEKGRKYRTKMNKKGRSVKSQEDVGDTYIREKKKLE